MVVTAFETFNLQCGTLRSCTPRQKKEEGCQRYTIQRISVKGFRHIRIDFRLEQNLQN